MFDRSVAPNSLSIWTHYLRGLQFYQSFQPKGCPSAKTNTAITIAAGEVWGDIYRQAGLLNLTVVGAIPESVGVGGYLTGGGHSPISGLYGTGSDQVGDRAAKKAAWSSHCAPPSCWVCFGGVHNAAPSFPRGLRALPADMSARSRPRLAPRRMTVLIVAGGAHCPCQPLAGRRVLVGSGSRDRPSSRGMVITVGNMARPGRHGSEP